MTNEKYWLPPKNERTITSMPGFSSARRSRTALMFSVVMRSYSSCEAMEGTLPTMSAVTSPILRMKRTSSPGAGSSSASDIAQKPFFR